MNTGISTTLDEIVSDEQVAVYHNKGYVRIEQVLSKAEVQQFHELVEQNRAQAMAREEDQRDGNMLHRVVNAWQKDSRFAQITFHPRVNAIAKILAGGDLRLWHDQVMVKPSGGEPTYMHQGQPNWSHQLNKDSHALSAWIALVDVPLEAGCMGYIPGSHQRWDLGQQMGKHDSFFELAPDLIDAPVEFLPLKAGDVAFHHAFTAHCAAANVSGYDRVAATVNFMDMETRYRDSEHCITDALDLQDGDVLAHALFPQI
ncbi:MAG: phytanoyl-CoA dioxygenase family protein [Planctomycetes bacterium]|nr:phytanoyl-CoA dioxygenase family protein [Planctomycetota bacterium]